MGSPSANVNFITFQEFKKRWKNLFSQANLDQEIEGDLLIMAIYAYTNAWFASTWAGKIVLEKWKFIGKISSCYGDIKVC